jgi:hypothetical protein
VRAAPAGDPQFVRGAPLRRPNKACGDLALPGPAGSFVRDLIFEGFGGVSPRRGRCARVHVGKHNPLVLGLSPLTVLTTLWLQDRPSGMSALNVLR